jgi:hypothetical protein
MFYQFYRWICFHDVFFQNICCHVHWYQNLCLYLRPSWSWSYGYYSCTISIYHYKSFEFEFRSRPGVLDTTLCDQVCQWFAACRRFPPGTPVSFINKADCHDITEILLEVALNTITLWFFVPFHQRRNYFI